MWTTEQRMFYRRGEERDPSKLTDVERAALEPLFHAASQGGRARKANMRAVMNAVLNLLRIGYPRRYLPRDEFPACATVYNVFRQFQRDGTWDVI
jgi:transposase